MIVTLESPNVIVVGSGWAGHAARALSRAGLLAAVVSRGSARSLALAHALAVPHFDDLERALGATHARRAIVAAGETRHAPLLDVLIARGLDVLCAHPVATTAEEVAALDASGRARGVVLRTDYTMRRTPEIQALLDALAGDGPLLRLSLQTPGRWLPIALDLALLLAGPVEQVETAWGWPEAVAGQVRSSPAAFPPSLLVGHVSGVASSWSPVTHMATERPVRLVASMARASWTLELPSGGATRVAVDRGGAVESTPVAPSVGQGTAPILGTWARVATSFAAGDYQGLASFEEEVARRRLWARIWRAPGRQGAS